MIGSHFTQKGNRTSSFWLNPSYFDTPETFTGAERKSVDLLKMASVRRSIGNFVSIVTGMRIPIKFKTAGTSYTTGKEVVISADVSNFDAVCGLALHEGSHIKLSDFGLLEKLVKNPSSFFSPSFLSKMATKYNVSQEKVSKFLGNLLKQMLNYVEDRRIDNFIYTTAPGYQGYYKAVYDEYFNSEEISKGLESELYREENWESYGFRVINLTNPSRDLKALKGLTEIWSVLDLKNIDRLNTS